jgi:very-short-patch-repair endonuclease
MSAEHKVKCRECGEKFTTITNTHLRKHEMTLDDYREKYPSEKLSMTHWLNEWRNSNGNRNNLKIAYEKLSKNEESRNKRINSIRQYWTKASSRSKHSKLMKDVVRSMPDKFQQCFSSNITDRMKMSNYERWVEDFGEDVAKEKMRIWKTKNIIPSKSKMTSIEKLCEKYLRLLKIEYVPQYDKIGKYWCDFYLPEYNLILEIDGDYWHANPEKYSEDDLIGTKKMKAKDIWEYDEKKTKDIVDAGYKILRIYGSKLKNISTDEFYEDIVQASKKLDE